MRHTTLLSIFLLFAVTISSGFTQSKKPANSPAITPQEADADFKIQGEYAGEITEDDGKKKIGIQVIALGNGKFRAVGHPGGLPGDGWNQKKKVEAEGELKNGIVTFADDEGKGIIKGGQFIVTDAAGKELGKLTRVIRKSPTLGKKPPTGAVVLFDGSTPDHFNGGRMTKDGLLMQGVTSKQKFNDFHIHMEFLLSYMPNARGQGRSNSGCYMQGRYEVQILDSFGLAGKNNECGGIYTIRDPNLNMCFPPLSWQTYDVDYTAAKFDKTGKKTTNAKMTVRHNGVLVQQNVELPNATRGAPVKEGAESGPIYIQDHSNPLRFRNIWLVEKKAAVATHPKIVKTEKKSKAAAPVPKSSAPVSAQTVPRRANFGPMLFFDDFESGSADNWEPSDPHAWRIAEANGSYVYNQFQNSKVKTPVRSPFNRSMIKDVTVGNFLLDLKVQSTKKDYPHRDMCLFFGYQDPAHMYYVHLGKRMDDHANNIFIVNDAPRTKISITTTAGTNWDDDWHHIRLTRDVETGAINVYFDDLQNPVMTAIDKTFAWGQVGLGSFDDTGNFDNIFLFGESVEPYPDFKPLFNGQTLNGWHKNPQKIGHGTGGRWSVENGVIVGEQDPPGSGNGGILLTDEKFDDFELVIDMKPDWGVCSGLFLRGNDRGQCFQMMVDYHDNGNVGHIYGEGTGGFNSRPFDIFGNYDDKKNLTGITTKPVKVAPPKAYTISGDNWVGAWKVNDWNRARVRVVGEPPKITTWINGFKVTEFDGNNFKQDRYDSKKVASLLGPKGSIAVQVHGGKGWPVGAKCQWKNIKIKRLSR